MRRESAVPLVQQNRDIVVIEVCGCQVKVTIAIEVSRKDRDRFGTHRIDGLRGEGA